MDNLQVAVAPAGSSYVSQMFDFFGQPPIDLSVKRIYYDEIYPTVPIEKTSKQFTFHSPPSSHFTQLSETKLELSIKITRPNGQDLPAMSQPAGANQFLGVGTINNVISSIFKDCEIKLNNQSISPLNQLYPHLSYIQSLLCYQSDARKSRLAVRGFFKDSSPRVTDCFSPASGYAKRAAYTDQSHIYDVEGPICHGMFQQQKPLLPMTDLSIQFFIAEPEFFLKTVIENQNFKFEILSAKLILKRLEIADDIHLAFENRLQREPMTYPINHIKVKSFVINAQSTTFHLPDLFNGQFLPKQAYITFVDQSKALGNYNNSPFEYDPHSVRDIFLRVGPLRLPTLPFAPQFSTTPPRILRCYSSLLGNDSQNEDNGIMITPDTYTTGFALYGFYFMQNQGHEEAFYAKKLGPCSLTVQFNNAPQNPLLCLVWQLHQEVLYCDHSRNFLINFPL